VDAGLLGIGEHLGEGTAGMGRVLGVGVQDAAVVMQARQRRDSDASGLQLPDVGVDCLEPDQRQTFNVRVGTARRFARGSPSYEHEQGNRD
jgi:hypothetical protein